MSSIEPSKSVTNQINPTYHANNNGGGLGGGSSSSYKNKKSKKQEEDKFSLSDEIDKEINQELMNKSLLDLIKEFFISIFNNILILLKIKNEPNEEDNDKKSL